jgi:pSer/pThr/pTyr-binding forkhead associated (FHA) protein
MTVQASSIMWVLGGAGPDDPPTFRLKSGAVKTIGRAPGADFIVDAPMVSRLHCRLTAFGDRVEVVDLTSTNGTFVNDRPVDKAAIRAGDRLRVGRMELTLRADPQA